jgi:citrate/tricarballylate utilization protein
MSSDATSPSLLQLAGNAGSEAALAEARRQIEICNACRYCEGFCAVFPAMTRQKAFSDGDMTQLANLCHNCRGCYYSCQYSAPHEFDLNVPGILAEVRQDSWTRCAWPAALGGVFHRHGVAVAAALVAGFAFLLLLIQALRPEAGQGFYAFLSHNAMLAVFLPAFALPIVALAVGLKRYWREVGGTALRWRHLAAAFKDAAVLRNLDGGQGQGCNFEKGDRYSNERRFAHQATLYGFLLCFAATSVATLMHYLFDLPAPYGLFSLPKLLGLSGGLLLCLGTLRLAMLKTRGERDLGAPRVWGGEMAFVLLLFFVSLSGLVLYAAGGTAAVPWLLALHLGSVLAFFLLTPYSKMAHGFYRLAALAREAQQREMKAS